MNACDRYETTPLRGLPFTKAKPGWKKDLWKEFGDFMTPPGKQIGPPSFTC